MSVKRVVSGLASVLALVVSLGSVAACSNDSNDVGERVVVSFELDAKGSPLVVREVGANKQHRYGQAQLNGSTELAGEQVQVELQCIINYESGNGPFDGFWTFTAPNGDLLALSYQGESTLRNGVGTIRGTVRVIGGTGKYVNVTGTGEVAATRKGNFSSSSVISYTINMNLSGMP